MITLAKATMTPAQRHKLTNRLIVLEQRAEEEAGRLQAALLGVLVCRKRLAKTETRIAEIEEELES